MTLEDSAKAIMTKDTEVPEQFLDSEEFTINLFTYKIKVSLSSDLGKDSIGTCNLGKQEMWLSNTIGKDMQMSVFFHEIVHLIDYSFGKMDLNETQTDCMAMGITSLIKDNPDFIRSLLSTLTITQQG